MSRFFGRGPVASTDLFDPGVREKEMWKLVETLQREKVHLSAERNMWRDKFLKVVGLGDMTYPTPEVGPAQYNPEEGAKELAGGPLGKHVSIAGLRAKHELDSRLKAAELTQKIKEGRKSEPA